MALERPSDSIAMLKAPIQIFAVVSLESSKCNKWLNNNRKKKRGKNEKTQPFSLKYAFLVGSCMESIVIPQNF